MNSNILRNAILITGSLTHRMTMCYSFVDSPDSLKERFNCEFNNIFKKIS
ncbi:MAG: hypothetical protein UR31_C0011G0009 [Parcubacteria group bacterium GW2011_GWA2_33_14]|nr:MAG: hypothetical protein UR31_C0011G0009 [Parcubacteria group bacterium GW2011_GWA2_33_14]